MTTEQEPQPGEPTTKTTTVHFFVPVHVGCPARPHDAPAASFYILEGSAEKIWVCEACAVMVRLEARSLEVEAALEQLPVAAEALVTRPAQELGPRALIYDPRAETYRVGGGDRCIGRIGSEVKSDARPDRNEPLTTWGLAQHPATPLTFDERLAVSAFMAGRWWAWAHAPGHDNRVQKPGPSRIVRPH